LKRKIREPAMSKKIKKSFLSELKSISP